MIRDGDVALGLVPLHPASDGSRNHPLLIHLERLLEPKGVKVFRFDRRPVLAGDDVPLEDQAHDACEAMARLREQTGVRIGVWGFSQGAWAAALAAATDPETAFLITVSASGVSPAQQMRYGTSEQLRRRGFATDELVLMRESYESFLRGKITRNAAQAVVDRFADRPWFDLAYVPRRLSSAAHWHDMDFEPSPVLRRVHCPTLGFWTAEDEWVPIQESIRLWRPAGSMIVKRLPDHAHEPAPGPEYETELVGFLSGLNDS